MRLPPRDCHRCLRAGPHPATASVRQPPPWARVGDGAAVPALGARGPGGRGQIVAVAMPQPAAGSRAPTPRPPPAAPPPELGSRGRRRPRADRRQPPPPPPDAAPTGRSPASAFAGLPEGVGLEAALRQLRLSEGQLYGCAHLLSALMEAQRAAMLLSWQGRALQQELRARLLLEDADRARREHVRRAESLGRALRASAGKTRRVQRKLAAARRRLAAAQPRPPEGPGGTQPS